jgi:APA family basic amino acid/polyamine antiporter
LHIPYVGDIFPLENFGVKVLTMLIILVLTYISYRSVQYGSRLQRILTLLKVIAIVLLIAGVLSSGKGSMHHLFTAMPSCTTWMEPCGRLYGCHRRRVLGI